ncbi:MAG: ABC transporter permease [Devosia sp. 67-54]|uniref:ABC transporter permease n=1 Tax=unclassified Devosia TaxID=196773 RepID=UPI00086AE44D|nr:MULTISPECIES: ABC transporter permease [unclassified Devosia]MBN9304630.1 ABC transporter permease [Devosia sp.]ODU59771.1 MAG: ABC transporter permease [Acetobacteraceae bacterium SCN 69-10]OJX15385.1 MAG: ABC transporter permease [Devosia sp. 67-54]
MALAAAASPARSRLPFDRLGLVVAVLAVAGALTPFAGFRANRIVPGTGVGLPDALPGWELALVGSVLAAAAAMALMRLAPRFRLLISLAALLALAIAIGDAARFLTPAGDKISRTSPATGFWLLTLAYALMASDAVARLKLKPWTRIGLLAAIAAVIAAILWSGLWNDLSVLREYANRADSFWREAGTHLVLALGSLLAAIVVGIPLGIVCDRVLPLRAVILNVLNAVQTIPSIALFGLLIAPLAWIAASVPGAAALGIAGIGIAPAMLALFLYSLLPVVANTVAGLDGVPPETEEAARGMGMTGRQRLLQIELPLAFPVILTGIRIVLVQNIGLATVAALIGGGGFGVFVFQGVGQTAMDLVLLGAVPTVALAFAAGAILDAVVEMVSRREQAA